MVVTVAVAMETQAYGGGGVDGVTGGGSGGILAIGGGTIGS